MKLSGSVGNKKLDRTKMRILNANCLMRILYKRFLWMHYKLEYRSEFLLIIIKKLCSLFLFVCIFLIQLINLNITCDFPYTFSSMPYTYKYIYTNGYIHNINIHLHRNIIVILLILIIEIIIFALIYYVLLLLMLLINVATVARQMKKLNVWYLIFV